MSEPINKSVAVAISTNDFFIAPNGRAMSTNRIGELRDGVTISTADLSDREIRAFGLTGLVLPGTKDANRLYGE